MIYHKFSDYFKALNAYLNTGWTIVNGNGYAKIKNQLVSEQEYWANNSRPLYEYAPKPNPDGQNIAQSVVIKSKNKRRKP